MSCLREEVERFKAWASTQRRNYGEWECDYEDWATLYAAGEASLANLSMSEVEVDLVLYVLARDNESELIKSMLEKYVDNGMRVARAAISCGDADARWQIADFLGTQNGDEAKHLLHRFADDEDEYVRRRALLASVRNNPTFAETTAWEWLASEHEYSRLASLRILRQLGSPELAAAIERLRDDLSPVVQAELAVIAAG